MYKPIIKYVLTAAVRDKILITFFLFLLVATSLASFLGGSTVIEQDQFSLVYAAGSLRIIGAICLILFVCFYVRRAFDNKEVEFLLSKPVSRAGFVIGHAVAFALLAVFIGCVISAVVLLSSSPDIYGWLIWSLSIISECVIISIMAMFFAMVLSSASGSALAGVGFYVLARMMGVILGIANLPSASLLNGALTSVVNVISIFIPRLDLMGQTNWLIYGREALQNYEADRFSSSFAQTVIESLNVPSFIAIQSVFFIAFLVFCIVFDFSKKQF